MLTTSCPNATHKCKLHTHALAASSRGRWCTCLGCHKHAHWSDLAKPTQRLAQAIPMNSQAWTSRPCTRPCCPWAACVQHSRGNGGQAHAPVATGNTHASVLAKPTQQQHKRIPKRTKAWASPPTHSAPLPTSRPQVRGTEALATAKVPMLGGAKSIAHSVGIGEAARRPTKAMPRARPSMGSPANAPNPATRTFPRVWRAASSRGRWCTCLGCHKHAHWSDLAKPTQRLAQAIPMNSQAWTSRPSTRPRRPTAACVQHGHGDGGQAHARVATRNTRASVLASQLNNNTSKSQSTPKHGQARQHTRPCYPQAAPMPHTAQATRPRQRQKCPCSVSRS